MSNNTVIFKELVFDRVPEDAVLGSCSKCKAVVRKEDFSVHLWWHYDLKGELT